MERNVKYGFRLDPGERIVRVIRRHPIALAPTLLTSGFMVLLAIGMVLGTATFAAVLPVPSSVILILAVALFVIGAAIFLAGTYAYRHTVLIFTNQHLIQVDQKSTFSRSVSQLSFEEVQDVKGKRVGVLATIFNYGDVEVQTAGERENFMFHTVSSPERIAEDALETHELHLFDEAHHVDGSVPPPKGE